MGVRKGCSRSWLLQLQVLHSCGENQTLLHVVASGAIGPHGLLVDGAHHIALPWGCSCVSTWRREGPLHPYIRCLLFVVSFPKMC